MPATPKKTLGGSSTTQNPHPSSTLNMTDKKTSTSPSGNGNKAIAWTEMEETGAELFKGELQARLGRLGPRGSYHILRKACWSEEGLEASTTMCSGVRARYDESLSADTISLGCDGSPQFERQTICSMYQRSA